jgi:uncharacterized protein
MGFIRAANSSRTPPHGLLRPQALAALAGCDPIIHAGDVGSPDVRFRVYVLHILAELDPQAADNVDVVIYGHSHQPKIETKNGILFFNPGSAGPRRFRLRTASFRVRNQRPRYAF